MRQLRWLSRAAGVCALVASASVTARPQQAAPAVQPAQEPLQPTVKDSEQQAVQQAVRQAELETARQGLIGTVSLVDATVTGAASTANDRATLAGNGTVVAKDHVAYVELARGGSVRVCATSGLHLTAGAADSSAQASATQITGTQTAGTQPAGKPAPLMLSLDRGALEVRMNATASDLLMTPDLRIGISEPGALDLRVRVTRNGDTCVENRVAGLGSHPVLQVASLFGDETYNVLPGQHVLFERASLHEVVDNESSPCGCPEATAATAPLVEAGNVSLQPGAKTSTAQAEAQHPFPAAVSQGLAPVPEVPQAPPGVVHTEVAATLTYSSNEADAAKKDTGQPPVQLPASAQKGGFFHAIGRFFKKIF